MHVRFRRHRALYLKNLDPPDSAWLCSPGFILHGTTLSALGHYSPGRDFTFRLLRINFQAVVRVRKRQCKRGGDIIELSSFQPILFFTLTSVGRHSHQFFCLQDILHREFSTDFPLVLIFHLTNRDFAFPGLVSKLLVSVTFLSMLLSLWKRTPLLYFLQCQSGPCNIWWLVQLVTFQSWHRKGGIAHSPPGAGDY